MSVNTVTSGFSTEPRRVLVLYGSPHENGATAKLLQSFLEPLQGTCRVDVVNAYREAIAPCTDCGCCKTRQGCPNPDFDRIDLLLRAADVLAVATPVYNLGFPAPLKSIFDRTQRYFSARFSLGVRPPIERPKTGVLLLTCGSPDELAEELIAKQLTMIGSVLNTKLRHRAVLRHTDALTPAALQQAQLQAQRAALAILTGV